MLTVATVGFAVNFWAWALLSPLGPLFKDDLGLSSFEEALLVAVPVVVGSLGRIPVGALTDRFGGRTMFPLVSAVTIVPVLFLGLVGHSSLAALLVGGFFLGVGGTAFAVGVPFVNAWFPPRRRGLAIGIFGAGMGGTAISALTTVRLVDGSGVATPFVVTAVVLAVYAVVAFLVLRDAPGRVVPTESFGRRLADTARLPATWQASWLYAVAFGGYVAFSVYLPAYLKTAYGLAQADAANRMAGFVLLAVLMRPVGGWLSDRLGPVRVLTVCLALVTAGAAVQAFTPDLMPLGTIAFLTMAAGLGAGSGAVFALVALLAPGNRVGSVTGVVGAAGGLGGFVPPLLMGALYGAFESYALGLAALALVAAVTLAFTITAVRRSVRANPGLTGASTLSEHRPTKAPTRAGLDSELSEALVRTRRFFTRAEISPDGRTLHRIGGRQADDFYRDRWSHDKVVRSTHGVNCTGSCSWKVYVKDGIITWEAQQTDYPSVGPDRPEYEPRGCPRGAAFSWYTYSPTRVRYPYVRGVLLNMYREARARTGDPVLAWASIVDDPDSARRYKAARGKGGLVRATWQEATELVAAAHVHTIKRYGPDRIAGFSPIPAMSMLSHASGARFVSLLGGSMLSFYDWYADLPVASPQVFGDQTDVPESGDWWDAGYLIMWGSNLPVTRTPDAHWMTEARYRGQKVVAVSPDYADNVKFADEWLPAQPGTDGALAMAMGHVILREFFVDRQVGYFTDYVKRYTDLPFLVRLDTRDGVHVPGKFLTAADLAEHADTENAAFKTVLLDAAGAPVVPGGSVGFRYGEQGAGRWNLDLGDVDPLLSLAGGTQTAVEVELPRFDLAGTTRRGVPVRRVGGHLVTTVFDLLLAQYGVRRDGLPGSWPSGYDDAAEPCTPAWQEPITGVPAQAATRIAREFAANAEESRGRSMIIMGAGTNHWFHSDTIYRAFLALTTLTGCQGVNGGGWAHYVGQEKCRPVTGWSQLAFGLDWARPPRQMIQTAYWYLHTDQFRYDRTPALGGRSTAELIALSARLGWMPSYPTFDRNPLDLADDADRSGMSTPDYVVGELTAGRLRFACEDPDAPENFPRVLSVWRANLLGSSGKGNEYFLKHLLGTDSSLREKDVGAPTGKLDLLLSLDFRMTSTTIFSDVVLPAATWYEKHDLSTTDMHPFVHSFNPAIAPPWQTRTDWAAFQAIAEVFSGLAEKHLGTRRDVVATPLLHDTPDELATPHGRVLDWRAGECAPVPGVTMPRLTVVERDYTAVAAKMGALGPLADTLGATTKGVTFRLDREVEYLRNKNGAIRGGPADGRPSLVRDVHACEAILALSGTTNGHLATQGFRTLEQRTGTPLADLAGENEGRRITFADTQAAPVPVITSPEWSGSETGGRRYSPFTINVERLKPWHTLTGRQHFYLDHDWMAELGEQLPVFRPPLNMTALFGEPSVGDNSELGIAVRYLTPHSKWSIHSEYQDNLFMLSLSRGGQTIWMSTPDARKIGVADNDWIEAVNRNGVVVARAVVSHRMPEGTVYMHHAQDRLIDVPRAETSGKRGGVHNSLTRLLIKPSHLIGGYAQLSFAFNYLGPTGNQRDEVTVIRRRSQEVTY